MLTAFTGAGVVLVFVFWALLPSSTPHPHEEYEFISKGTKEERVEPKKVLKEAEKVLAKAELVVKKLEEEKSGEGGGEAEKPKEKKEAAKASEKKPEKK